MPHPLEQKLAALRRRMRWMTVVYAVSVVAAAVLATLTVLGACDYLFRLQDRGLRVIASLVLLGVAVWMLYRYAAAMLLTTVRHADLALCVQRRFPGLNDGLISAVEFLDHGDDDTAAGSPALRRAVVEHVTAETQRLDFAQAISVRPAMRAALLLSLTCVVAGSLVALAPAVTRVAVVRLLNPFGNAVWPRANHLAIRRPQERVARGQAFQVEIVDADGTPLPPEVRIHYRFEQPNAAAVEEIQHIPVTRDVAVARRDNVETPFSYRVEGGDDQSLPWLNVAVAEPPAIASASVEVIPPNYTGRSATQASRHIRALVGSRVRITAKATKPLQSALLSVNAEKIPAELSDDGGVFRVDFPVERSGSYWFELVDRDGFAGGDDDRWEIQAVPDLPPTVSIDRPESNLVVTPRATVPLQLTANDDLAIREIAISFQRSDLAAEKTLTLWRRSAPGQASAAAQALRTSGRLRIAGTLVRSD